MREQDAHQLLVLFLSEHWSTFEDFCDERGEDAQEVYEAIGGEDE